MKKLPARMGQPSHTTSTVEAMTPPAAPKGVRTERLKCTTPAVLEAKRQENCSERSVEARLQDSSAAEVGRGVRETFCGYAATGLPMFVRRMRRARACWEVQQKGVPTRMTFDWMGQGRGGRSCALRAKQSGPPFARVETLNVVSAGRREGRGETNLNASLSVEISKSAGMSPRTLTCDAALPSPNVRARAKTIE